MAAKKPNEQQVSDWRTLHYPDNVRKRSGMYIGENDSHGLFQIVKEPIDNSNDEFMAGRNNSIHVHVDNTKYYVVDTGGGIPVEDSKELGKAPLEAAFNELHSGGKFEGKAYASGSAGCFVGSTRVKLLDGTNPTIKELYKKYHDTNEKFWVYGYDLDGTTAFMPRQCYNVQLTKHVNKLAIVYLDNGEKVKCTVDHRFLTYDGEYKRADSLERGTRLRAFGFDEDGCTILSHAVTKVRIVSGSKPLPVYDLSVEQDHNFLLSAGVFVHNCNGVGAAVTSAMSDRLAAYTFRKKGRARASWYGYKAAKGIGSGIRKAKLPKLPKQLGSIKKGTVVLFEPDMSLFQTGSKLNIPHLFNYLDTLAYLSGGITIKLTTPSEEHTINHPNGTVDFVAHVIKEHDLEQDGAVFHHVSDASTVEGRTDVSFAITNSDKVLLDTYVCASLTSDGGTHLNAFKTTLNKALTPYKLKKHVYTNDDLLVGLVGIVNFNMVQPQFSSQTKERLTSQEGKLVGVDIQDALIKFFKSNKALAKRMLDKATAMKKNRDNFNANKKALVGLTSKRKGLPAKLARSNPKMKACDVELALVEGDSAGGSAKDAVDKSYQEVLPLKGKIVAAYKNSLTKLMESEEVKNIFQAIGFDASLDNPLENMRVGKVALLMDADVDGCHIELLVLSAIWKLCPELIKGGHVYLIKGPLFCTSSKPLIWGDTLEEVAAKAKPNTPITRIKGWGEINGSALYDFAFNPKTRRWIQILPPQDKEAEQYFLDLVGKDTTARRKLLNL